MCKTSTKKKIINNNNNDTTTAYNNDKNKNTSIIKGKTTKALSFTPPPYHTIIVLLSIVLISIYMLPSITEIDKIATIETYTNCLFPHIFTPTILVLIRLIISILMWTLTIQCYYGPGVQITVPYLPSSKCISVPNPVIGIRTLFPFTSWAWMLLSLHFTLSAYITYQAIYGKLVHTYILRLGIIVWEIAAPCTLLVASVVRYAIWPASIKENDDEHNNNNPLKTYKNLLMHNANVILALFESCILSGLPIRWKFVPLAPLYGCTYVVFAWLMQMQWNDKKYGPQFMYYFFDTTIPGYYCTITFLILLVILVIFFGLFSFITNILTWTDTGIYVHLVVVVTISSLVMRFRD